MSKSTTRPHSNLSTALRIFLFLLCMTFFLYLQFRVQVQNGFTVLYGDGYDAAIVVAILEHWLSVWHGASQWSELYYFYPYKNTLAQTDGYFIVGIIYSVIRSLGLDPFISSELSNAVIKCIGFVSFFCMLRKVFNVNFYWSILAAGLFMIANNLTSHGTRVQLATLAFAPIVTTLLWATYQQMLQGGKYKLALYGCSAAVILGAWALTCFYITWFYIFFATFFVAFLLLVSSQDARIQFWHNVKIYWLPLTIVAAVTILSILPLLAIYLPKAAESGFRSYDSALGFTVPPAGVLQIGESNLLFGELYNKALKILIPSYTWEGEYYNTGIAPIIFILFIFASASIISHQASADQKSLLRACVMATFATWILIIRIDGHSLWYFVFNYFPGAKALNVVAAYQIFLTFPIVTVCAVYLSRMSPRLPASILLILVIMLIGEELNRAKISLDRQAEIQKVSNIPAAPAGCEVFYVSGWPVQTSLVEKIYAHNVSAMVIAELIKMPTINGFASFNPPDWNLADPNSLDYEARVATYLANHKIHNTCKLDLASKTWHPVVR